MTAEVAVCVSTRNRAGLLPRLLAHLEAQTLPWEQFEVVIVDNGSSDNTWEVLLSAAETSPLQLRVFRNDPGKGPAAGRNRAWREAAAPLCAFTDDDCMPTRGWLSAVVERMSGRVAIGAGAIVPPRDEISLIGPFTRIVVAPRDYAAWCATANLVLRRCDLEAVGGFDESFLNVAGEDTDLGLRVMARGVELMYLDNAVVEHGVEQVGLRGRLRDQQRWVDIPAVVAKNPGARRLLLRGGVFWKRTHPRVLLLLAGTAALASGREWGAALTWPWLHERWCVEPLAETRAERVATLPAALLLDLSEVVVMIRGSIRHREVVL
jgi:glycosyltransferase involved in cell wall biosynthesis